MPGGFAEDTSVRKVANCRYEADVGEAWNLRPIPQGGVVTALALRAMAAELDDPSLRLRTLHTTFVAQVNHGAVDIEVERLREGRSMSHLRAEVRNRGAERGHITTAVFGSSREGFRFSDLEPPELPPPEACPSFRDPPPADAVVMERMPFWEMRVEGRAALGHAPWEEYVPERAETAYWYRFDLPAIGDDGVMDPLALVVLADTMPGAVGERVGRHDNRAWFAPSVDLTVHILDECRSEWVLAYNLGRHAGDGYASAEMSLWDCGERGTDPARLVAYGTQLFVFRFL